MRFPPLVQYRMLTLFAATLVVATLCWMKGLEQPTLAYNGTGGGASAMSAPVDSVIAPAMLDETKSMRPVWLAPRSPMRHDNTVPSPAWGTFAIVVCAFFYFWIREGALAEMLRF